MLGERRTAEGLGIPRSPRANHPGTVTRSRGRGPAVHTYAVPAAAERPAGPRQTARRDPTSTPPHWVPALARHLDSKTTLARPLFVPTAPGSLDLNHRSRRGHRTYVAAPSRSCGRESPSSAVVAKRRRSSLDACPASRRSRRRPLGPSRNTRKRPHARREGVRGRQSEPPRHECGSVRVSRSWLATNRSVSRS